jgi:hypothetical protein
LFRRIKSESDDDLTTVHAVGCIKGAPNDIAGAENKKAEKQNGSAAQVWLGSFNPLARSGGHVYRESRPTNTHGKYMHPEVIFVRGTLAELSHFDLMFSLQAMEVHHGQTCAETSSRWEGSKNPRRTGALTLRTSILSSKMV